MSIISYAQNFEDVMLWRALGHIQNGFYIDIGAQHPVVDSVSKAFYEKSWRGIHVEATPAYAALLRQDRPDETVIQAAVNDAHGTITFFEIPETGISTGDAEIAQSHRAQGFDVHEITVPCVTLLDVFKHAQSREIHWLKIDVEGMELQVLRSWGECKALPWIVVVESTLPLTQTDSHNPWEYCLLDRGYTHVYFDGLNRYYLSPEQPQLAAAFSSAPNVFDDFSLNGTASAPFCLAINARHRQTEQALQQQLAQAHQEQIDANLDFDSALTAASNQLQGSQDEAIKIKLNLADEALRHVELERALRGLASETYRQAQTQAQAHLQNLAQREREVAAQLLTLQQQAAQKISDQASSHSEQERALLREHADRERILSQQLQVGQQELSLKAQDGAQLVKEHAEQTRQARQEIEALLRTVAQREQEVSAQLQTLQQQAAQEISKQASSHSEQEHALLREHSDRERILSQQLQAGQQELSLQAQDGAQRVKEHAEQTRQARQEIEALLRTAAQREQAVAAQLLTLQRQAVQEKTELARVHKEQERSLQSQHAEREKSLKQHLQASQQELDNLQHDRMKREHDFAALLVINQRQAAQEKTELARGYKEQERLLKSQQAELEKSFKQQLQARQQEFQNLQNERVKREREVGAQLLSIQQQASHEAAEQARGHAEQTSALHRHHAEREQALNAQLQAGQLEMRLLARDRSQREKEHAEQVRQHSEQTSALQRQHAEREQALIQQQQVDTQALQHSQQLQTQQNEAELSTRLAEHRRWSEVCAALETQLRAEISSEQQTCLQLHQSLAEVQQNLAAVHASLTWRITAPLRALALLFAPNQNLGPASPMAGQEAPCNPVIPPISEPQPINIQQMSIESTMPASAQSPKSSPQTHVSTLDEMLALHDQHFVHCAYHMLLGRAPDPEGLSYYLDRLRQGFSKMRIVAQLRLSEEGKAHAAKLPGLDSAIQRHQKGQYPLIGWLFRRLSGGEGNHPTERKLRGIENQLFLLGNESNRRFNQLETALAGLHHLVVQQMQSIVVDLGGTPKNCLNLATFTPIQLPAPDGLKQLSPRARDTYLQLKTAAVIHAGRAA